MRYIAIALVLTLVVFSGCTNHKAEAKIFKDRYYAQLAEKDNLADKLHSLQRDYDDLELRLEYECNQ